MEEGTNSRWKSGNGCCHSVQNLLSSSLLFKYVKIKIYKNRILLAVLFGCETWSLILSEECRVKVFENRVLRRIFRPKMEWRKLHIEELNDLFFYDSDPIML
jgi:hypothetical protein